MDTTRVLLIGLGSLGSQVLDLLLRIPVDLEVLVCSLSESKLEQRTNLSHLAALQLGCNPRASWAQLDVSDVDRTAELIARFRPDIIFSAVCLQSWWVIGTLPKEAFDRLDRSQVGPWLPMHLALVYKLMRAVRASGHRAIVVNASYPDVVNPMLNKVGLGPDIGVGNVSNAIPGLRMALSFTLGVPVEQIQVRFFAHHYVSHRLSGKGNSGGAPFHLTVYLEGKDITPHIDIGTVCKLLATRFKRLGGADGQLVTAASATNVLSALILNDHRLLHAPGPMGLPGGYALNVGRDCIEIALPEKLSLEQAIQLNELGMRFDGIERIDSDGTAWFTEGEMSIVYEALGYHRKKMRVEESEDCATELLGRYRSYVDHLKLARATSA